MLRMVGLIEPCKRNNKVRIMTCQHNGWLWTSTFCTRDVEASSGLRDVVNTGGVKTGAT